MTGGRGIMTHDAKLRAEVIFTDGEYLAVNMAAGEGRFGFGS